MAWLSVTLHDGGQQLRLARQRLLARPGPLACWRCGERIDATLSGLHPLGLTVGHVQAVAAGGSDRDANLAPEHRRCNLRANRRVAIAARATIATPVFLNLSRSPRSVASTPRVRGDRSAEYAKRVSRAMPDMPALHVGHPLFDQAREVVGRRTGSLVTLYDTSYDDHIGAVVLALVEGADPTAALQASRRFFTSWRFLDIADIAA